MPEVVGLHSMAKHLNTGPLWNRFGYWQSLELSYAPLVKCIAVQVGTYYVFYKSGTDGFFA